MAVAVGLHGHTCACAHAGMLMCMLGCLSNLVMGFLEKTFLLVVARTRASSLPFSPLPPPPPYSSRLREEHCI